MMKGSRSGHLVRDGISPPADNARQGSSDCDKCPLPRYAEGTFDTICSWYICPLPQNTGQGTNELSRKRADDDWRYVWASSCLPFLRFRVSLAW